MFGWRDRHTHHSCRCVWSDEILGSHKSDPHATIRLALEAAQSAMRVLKEPAADCVLVNFGDSTIDLELRFWIRDPGNGTAQYAQRGMLKPWDLYQQHGVELPAPQRELIGPCNDPITEAPVIGGAGINASNTYAAGEYLFCPYTIREARRLGGCITQAHGK